MSMAALLMTWFLLMVPGNVMQDDMTAALLQQPLCPMSKSKKVDEAVAYLLLLVGLVSSEDDDEHEYEDDEEWMENATPKGLIKVFYKTHYNDRNVHYNNTNGWTSELAEARYNEMIALQKEKEGLDEVKCLSEKQNMYESAWKAVSLCIFI